jgi:hypothetical protein
VEHLGQATGIIRNGDQQSFPGSRGRSPTGHGGEYSRPRPPHDASAATISNGLCDHTRAMPRPVANIVRACVFVTLRTELATFGRTAAVLPCTSMAWPSKIVKLSDVDARD